MRKITHICIDGKMIDDWFTHWEAFVYSCLWQLYYYWENTLPTMNEMSNTIYYSDKQVMRSIKKLVDNNLIHIYKKNGKRYFYCYLDKYISHPAVNPYKGYPIWFIIKMKLLALKTRILKR